MCRDFVDSYLNTPKNAKAAKKRKATLSHLRSVAQHIRGHGLLVWRVGQQADNSMGMASNTAMTTVGSAELLVERGIESCYLLLLLQGASNNTEVKNKTAFPSRKGFRNASPFSAILVLSHAGLFIIGDARKGSQGLGLLEKSLFRPSMEIVDTIGVSTAEAQSSRCPMQKNRG